MMPLKLQRIEDRFWPYVDKRRDDECWPWIGARMTKGYGRISWRHNGKRFGRYAHRVSWEIANNAQWPDGKIARHSCDNPSCVNPSHITPGTAAENNRDTLERGHHHEASKSHCVNGHELSDENLFLRPQGWRGCRECRRTASKAWHNRKMAR